MKQPWATNNYPLRGGKGHPYEGGIRIPTVLYHPQLGNKMVETPVITNDYYPTIAEMLNIEIPDNYHADGISLLSLLNKGDAKPNRCFYWHFPGYRYDTKPFSVIRHGDWKLIYFYENDAFELYNLAEDI